MKKLFIIKINLINQKLSTLSLDHYIYILDYDGHVSRDMLHLGLPTILSRTKNKNSRILIDGCKNIIFNFLLQK
jgi:hypothetical protein